MKSACRCRSPRGPLFPSAIGAFNGDDDVVRYCCQRCEGYVGYAPATDTPSTAIELAGAQVAAEWADENYTPGCDRFEYCPQTKSDELCGHCEGLYLAHAIATHKDSTP